MVGTFPPRHLDWIFLTWIKVGRGPLREDEGMKTVIEPAAPPTLLRSPAKTKNNLAGMRLAREHHTMAAMVRIFCRDKHATKTGLCPECRQFLDYAGVRLERCRFGEEKPTCARCPVHCYQRDRREQARVVMRYAGPRMMWEHPVMSLRHWLDGFRKAPEI